MDITDNIAIHDLENTIGMEGIQIPTDITENFEISGEEKAAMENISKEIGEESSSAYDDALDQRNNSPSFGGSCTAGCAGSCEGSCYSLCADTCYSRCLGSYTS